MEGQVNTWPFSFSWLLAASFASSQTKARQTKRRVEEPNGPAEMPLRPVRRARNRILTETSKRSRDQAESIFSKTQTQSLSLNRIVSEQDAASKARELKTARLRQLRLEKEAQDLAEAAAKPAARKRVGKH
jgi:hypothetical protein